MKRYSFAVFAALSGPAFSVAQDSPAAVDVAHEARLQKPVTETLTTMPLPAIMKALSKDSGVPIESTMSMSSLKATVLVKEQPVGEVMARLADVFHGEWHQSGDLYRLSVPTEWSNRESAYLRAEDEAMRKQASAALSTLTKGASIPYKQVLQELADGKGSADRLDTLKRVQTPGAYLLGYTFAHLSNSDLQAFWNGKVIRASVLMPAPATPQQTPPPAANAAAPPEDQGIQGRTNRTLSPGQQPTPPPVQQAILVKVFASYNPLTGELKTSEPSVRSGGTNLSGLIAHPSPDGELVTLPFAKDVLGWSRVEEDHPALKTPLSGQAPNGSYFNGQRSLGDILAWIHEKTNVSIVADAFRVATYPYNGSGPVGSMLEKLAGANHAFLRTEKGFVMMRHGGFWRLKTIELPEDAYSRIESAKLAKLDDYATFAGSLKPLQSFAFRVPNGVLTRFDPEPLRVGMSALRFYATLGSAERQAALAGNAIAFTRLSGPSRELFLEAMDDPAGQAVGSASPNLNDSEIASRMGFLMGSGSAERVVLEANGSARRGIASAKKMLFGTSSQDGVQYLIPID